MPPRPRRADARSLAHDVLMAVFAKDPKPAEQVFEQHPDLDRLSERDRAFARLLYATCLRRMGRIDLELRPHLKTWPKDLALCLCLRLGVTQIRYTQTPVHAAISESVKLARSKAAFGAKMVNAVLRRVSEAAEPQGHAVDDLPDWLRQRWSKTYGGAKVQSIAGHLVQPALDLSVPFNRTHWAAKLGGEPLGAMTLRLKSGPVPQLPGYDQGDWWVQDLASAAIVPLLGDISGKKALDLCAAPGGKTAQLLALGAKVTAIEAVGARGQRLRDNLDRLGMSCAIHIADARTWQSEQGYDLVLLDAPCSATGTLRRHPDIAWARHPRDITRMAALQRELLHAASRHLLPSGELVYIVCSLEPEEGPAPVREFLQANSNWRLKPFEADHLSGLPCSLLQDDGSFRSFPDSANGMDGFYAARLIKLE